MGMLRQSDLNVVDAAERLVMAFGEAGREYVAEIVAVASGRSAPDRLDELAAELTRRRVV
jgi:hypothetical protein